MKKVSFILFLATLSSLLFLIGCAEGGPPDSEVQFQISDRFGGSNVIVTDKSKCDLTSNQKAEDNVTERWIVRYSYTSQYGDFVAEDEGTMQKNSSGIWEWYTRGATCDRGY